MAEPVELVKGILGVASLLVVGGAAITLLSNPTPEALVWFTKVWVGERIPTVVSFLVAAPVVTVIALFLWKLLQQEGLVR
jgi:hypothetical protein